MIIFQGFLDVGWLIVPALMFLAMFKLGSVRAEKNNKQWFAAVGFGGFLLYMTIQVITDTSFSPWFEDESLWDYSLELLIIPVVYCLLALLISLIPYHMGQAQSRPESQQATLQIVLKFAGLYIGYLILSQLIATFFFIIGISIACSGNSDCL